MLAIYKRELRSYFITPIGYVFTTVFLIMSGLAFSFMTLQSSTTNVSNYYVLVMFFFIILIPLLTMKMFSEEKKTKTEQILLTSPISITDMVLAKFLAAYTLFAATLLASCVFFISLYVYGTPNTAVLIATTLGILLIGGAFIALGLFISSLTENQLIAALITIVSIFAMLGLGLITSSIPDNMTALRVVLKWVSVFDRYYAFTFGIFDFNALLYYISIIGVFIFLTVRVYEKRRWE
ncbi:MAG: ABC transporter permease [Oscillospiraceae bacterium]|nr:ABC transporter permease [Oscillospiraceae bacterium]